MQTIITKRKSGSNRVQIKLDPKSKVEQSHKKKCNINTIMAKFGKTGLLPQRKTMPKYGDFSNSLDFHTAKNRLISAQKDFMSLPSEIRKIFNNDPGHLVEFINDPNNLQEAQEMGLLPMTEPPAETPPAAPTEPETTTTTKDVVEKTV